MLKIANKIAYCIRQG